MKTIQRNPRIYIVDDDKSVSRALKRLLISEGFNVEVFASAQSFLDSVPLDTKSCLILDLRMPGMDGFGLQKKLKECRSSLHIIFITAYAQADDREYAMEQGADGFLLKPFSGQSLLELIDEVLENKMR